MKTRKNLSPAAPCSKRTWPAVTETGSAISANPASSSSVDPAKSGIFRRNPSKPGRPWMVWSRVSRGISGGGLGAAACLRTLGEARFRLENQSVIPDPDLVAVLELDALNGLPVDRGPVVAVQVGQDEIRVFPRDPGVLPGDERPIEDDVVFIGPADDDLGLLEGKSATSPLSRMIWITGMQYGLCQPTIENGFPLVKAQRKRSINPGLMTAA